MDDREVVATLAADDPAGIAEAYDRYAAALYDYCQWMLREPTDAAEALQDTFVIATATTRDLPRVLELRRWLYSVARRECLRRLRTRVAAGGGKGRTAKQPDETNQQDVIDGTMVFPRTLTQPADTPSQTIDATSSFYAVDSADDLTSLNLNLEQAEVQRLICAVLAELTPREREVIELYLRHGLDGAELATVLGVSLSRAHVLASRACTRLEKALGALLVASNEREAYPALRELLSESDGRLTKETADLVGQHIEQCENCPGYHQGPLRPAAFSNLLPLVSLPAGYREQVVQLCSASDASSIEYRRQVARRAEPVSLKRIWPTAGMLRRADIRDNPGTATATAIVVMWALAGVTASLLIVIGSHSARALPTRLGRPGSSSVTPAAIPTAPATVFFSTPAAKPSREASTPTSAPPSLQSSPAIIEPLPSSSPSPSPSPSKSPSPKPSKSPSPKPSKSPSPNSTPSASPSPSQSASPSPSATG